MGSKKVHIRIDTEGMFAGTVPINEASGQLVIGKASPAQYDPGLVVERDTGPHGLEPYCARFVS